MSFGKFDADREEWAPNYYIREWLFWLFWFENFEKRFRKNQDFLFSKLI